MHKLGGKNSKILCVKANNIFINTPVRYKWLHELYHSQRICILLIDEVPGSKA
jgi:hypothetical protein